MWSGNKLANLLSVTANDSYFPPPAVRRLNQVLTSHKPTKNSTRIAELVMLNGFSCNSDITPLSREVYDNQS